MAEINFTGTVGKETKLEFTPNTGTARFRFSVCDTKSKKTGPGPRDWEEVSKQWFNVTVWGPLAEHLDEHVKTGERVKVTGEFFQRLYESRDGSQGVSLDVNAWGVQVLPKRGGGQSNTPVAAASQSSGWGTNDDDQAPF